MLATYLAKQQLSRKKNNLPPAGETRSFVRRGGVTFAALLTMSMNLRAESVRDE